MSLKNKSMSTIGDGGDISGKLHIIDEHVHSASLVYPTLADGVTLAATTGGGNWTLGAFFPIVPANTITELFDIHYLSIEDLSANSVYELHLFYGATDIFAGSVRFTKNAVQDGTVNVPFQTILIPANSQIRGKLATTADNGETADVSIFYHTYE